MTTSSIIEQMTVTVPEGKHGAVEVTRFEVTGQELASLGYMMQGRGCLPGTYTRLDRNGSLWMSDTTAERLDHARCAYVIRERGDRILIGGLGLGMIVNFALLQERVEHIDVVEIDADVLTLVAPHYERMAACEGKSITFHQGDVFNIAWPKGTRWDVAWFDVWGDISTDDLAAMTKLRRSYGRRAGWCRCWGQELLRGRR